MKKIYTLALCLMLAVICVIALPVTAQAADSSSLTFTLNNGGGSYCVSKCATSASGELTIPATYNGLPVTAIGDSAFYGCRNLTKVTIPNGVVSVGKDAFYNCSALTGIAIPKTVTSIGNWAFFQCNKLTDIYLSDIAAWLNITFGGFSSNPLQANSLNANSGGKNLYLNGTLVTNLVIPSGVTSLGDWAFYGCNNITSVTIPNSVTSIGENAFYKCSDLTSITIPDSVSAIGQNAFADCDSLTGIVIPKNVTVIANDTFSGCSSLSSVTIPNGVTSIGDNAFSGCTGLTDVMIPNGVTSIGDNAFYGCSGLTNIGIPDSVDYIGENAFSGCDDLTGFKIPNGITAIDAYAFYGCSSLTSVTIPNSVTSIGDKAFYGCSGLKTITIPNSVTSIGHNAFYGCSGLTGMTIPNSVTFVGSYSFTNCSGLTSVTISKNITSIAISMFSGCSSLTSVTIPEGPMSIDTSAFSGCSSLTSVSIPKSVTAIGNGAFSDCTSLTKIYLADIAAWLKITSDEFYYGNPLTANSLEKKLYLNGNLITNLVIPNGVTTIGEHAFAYCSSLTSISIPQSVTYIGEGALLDCSGLTNLAVPNSVTSIGAGAFSGCSKLKSITLPFVGGSKKTANDTYQYPFGYIFGELEYNGGIEAKQSYHGSSTTYAIGSIYYIPASLQSVTITGGDILYGAFYQCKKLTNITIPNSATAIGDYAFFECDSLTSIHIPNSATAIGDYAFFECDSLTSIHIPDGVTSIGESAFGYCRNMTDVSLGNGITSIGYSAFISCDSLSDITIPGSVTSIGGKAFKECFGMTSVTIAEGVESIGEEAFALCGRLKSISIPGSLTSIGSQAFTYSGLVNIYITDIATWLNIPFEDIGSNPFNEGFYYKNLYVNGELVTHLVIPDGVTSIRPYAFAQCQNITKITIPDSVTSIGAYAFSGYFDLTDITIPGGVDSIGDGAFAWSKKLASVTFGDGIASIGDGAFYDCDGLTVVIVPESVTFIGRESFSECEKLTSIYYGGTKERLESFALKFDGQLHYACTDPENHWTKKEAEIFTCTGYGEDIYSCPCGYSYSETVSGVPGDHIWSDWERQVEPTSDTRGLDLRWCTGCGEIEQREVATIPEGGAPVNPFVDVEVGKFYYDPVLWAYYGGITTGKDATHFDPSGFCTRSQVVTFLWRAAGKPEPTSSVNPFPDVPENKFYTKAVLWAVEKGITDGFKDGTFGPNDSCTRAQIVTFLWRYFGQPQPASSNNPFPDVPEGKFYTTAVLWAVEKGITGGYKDGTFGPNKTCTRDQIVTFLYRAMV